MTPEERFTKIENLLHSLTESQVRFQIELEQQGAQIEKQNAGIRDLIVVSRTLLDSHEKVTEEIRDLREAQKEAQQTQREAHREIDDKLKALIDIVDGIIRKKPGQ